MNASSRPARPKRAGEEFARSSLNHDGEPSNKKARFDARNPSTLQDDAGVDEEDPDQILELDVIGSKGQQAKRNAVELDGYDSDSSNENFDNRAEAKAEAQRREKRQAAGTSKDEEENDLFADLAADSGDGDEDEEIAKEGKKKRKEVRFLDERDIEGQVQSSTAGGHVSADFSLNGKGKGKAIDKEVESSSDDGDGSGGEEERARVDDEDVVDVELGAGAKKKHAPKLDAFNMRNEAEEGRFDDAGNFVRKAADPFAVHDAWLEGSSKADMKRAREAQEKRENAQRTRDIADDAVPDSDVLAALIQHMGEEETVLEALARLGGARQKHKQKKQAARRRNSRRRGVPMELDADGDANAEADKNADDDAAEAHTRDAVEAITAAADRLLTRGQLEIYDAERSLLRRQYKRETGEDWIDEPSGAPGGGVQAGGDAGAWEYRWSDARDGGEHHGPYDGATMAAWNDAGYFGDGVEFRRVGGASWTLAADFAS